MVIKLYIDYVSQPSRAVLALCILANIPHEVIEVKLFKADHRSQ
jgi:glutathione S-transferase